MACKRCSTRLDAGALWCHACGEWASDKRAVCEGPEADPATGACVVCGTPVCGTCGTEADNRTFCGEAGHEEIARTHVLFGRYTSEFEADWVAANFFSAGIGVMMFPFRMRPGLYGLALEDEAAVFVLRQDEERCRQIMKQYAESKGT